MSIDSTSSPQGGALQQQLLNDFARAYLAEQRSQRRWRWFWRILLTVLLVVLIWGSLESMPSSKAPTTPHTALVEIRGEIGVDADANADNLNTALRSAFEDEGAQAVVLRLNSPGGSPVQAGLINDEIRRLKTLHKKKVYAVCEEMCASAAFYIAVAADQIYVDKASLVGSIGVLMDGFGFTGAMEKFGVERRLLTAGANKGMLDPFSPRNPNQEVMVQSMLDQIHQQFIKVVRDGRGKRLKETPETFSGLFWNGEEAVKLGLADHLGSLDSVARDVVKTDNIIDYTVKENLAERLAKRFGASIGAGAVQSMRSAVSVR
ncbi:S49 family peptidase [Aquabacterium soli]|jgi:protease IV|uniref:S49 family peptidase n=1 Tax=Aquabacterium soli TaxID=2493092 RepID=A0A3R8T1Q7_9BURK|nr:S49 family peptidase [Aquabacterium soli]RRS04170.1 S49 family peptidase [Aquabacterium soli]